MLLSASTGRKGSVPGLEEDCEPFHQEKDSVGLTVDRKYEGSLTPTVSLLHIPSYWDCAGSSH